jgi:alpha-L-rhamnosidase
MASPAPSPAAQALAAAHWITAPEPAAPAAGERPAYEFRTTFSLDEVSTTAVLTATAHGIYEAFVNGQRVGDEELAPGLTSYQKTLHVQQHPVAALLAPGENELRLVLSDGWFRGRTGASRIPDHYGTATAVIAQLELGDGSTIATDDSWQVAAGAITAADLMDGQRVDLRRETTDWMPVQVADTALTRDTARLTFTSAPPVRRTRTYPAVSVTRLPSGRQIVDFGTFVNGWVQLRNLGPADTQTDLIHGEWLLHDGDLNVTHAAYTQWPVGGLMTLGQHDTVISRGVAGDVFEPRHTTHGFRYVAIDGRDDDIAVSDLDAVMVRSDLRSTATFRSSDARLNELHQIAVQSWLVNSCDVPTDCPQRERWGYTGDYQIFAHTAAFLDDVDLFSRKWLRSLADDQHDSGLITNVAPMCGIDPVIPMSLDGAAGWGDAATVVPWELYRAYGDPQILRENIGMMTRWLEYVRGRARDHRHASRVAASAEARAHEQYIWDTGWQWGEWLEPNAVFDPETDQGIVSTAYFSRTAGIVADALDVLGDVDRAAEYRDLAEHVAEAWRIEFFDAASGRLSVDRQSHYVRALAFGLVSEADRPHVAQRLVELVDEAGGHLTTGFLSTGMLLPTLAENGHVDTAYRLLRQDSEPSWMTMLDRGATTVWESWNGVDADGNAFNSLAHYSKGAVIDFLHEHTIGLRQTTESVGWQHFVVEPKPDASLEWAELAFDSRHGRIEVRWTATPHGLDLTIVVPPACTAEVRTPAGATWTLTGGTHHLADAA